MFLAHDMLQPPVLPIKTLSSHFTQPPAHAPISTFLVLLGSAFMPASSQMIVLYCHVVILDHARHPIAILFLPLVRLPSALYQNPTLLLPP